MKILILLFVSFVISSCTLQKENIKKPIFQISYYGSLYDIENTGKLKFYTKYSLKNLVQVKKDFEASYIKAYYRDKNTLVKAEKYTGSNKLPNEIYFINKNNINYKTKRRQKASYIDCNLTYKMKDSFRVKITNCDDGTKEILTTKIGRIFISYFKYNKKGNIIKKEIATKKGIEIYENGKLLEIRNEIE